METQKQTLSKLFDDKAAIKEAVREVLEEAGLVTPHITRQEIVDQVGRYRFDRAVREGWIHRQKGAGRNCQIRTSRADYIQLLKEGRI